MSVHVVPLPGGFVKELCHLLTVIDMVLVANLLGSLWGPYQRNFLRAAGVGKSNQDG